MFGLPRPRSFLGYGCIRQADFPDFCSAIEAVLSLLTLRLKEQAPCEEAPSSPTLLIYLIVTLSRTQESCPEAWLRGNSYIRTYELFIPDHIAGCEDFSPGLMFKCFLA